ncbi:MAG TPA: TVP38/TMEM64 family protein [Candidatus Gallacutalibacter pullistercoris]|nr:TVP38/TMEM64 family protein [Candidatus Gallacutalibacter pullistercoris]
MVCEKKQKIAEKPAWTETEESLAAYRRRRKLVSLVSLGILFVFFALITIFIGKPMLDGLKDPEAFRRWVDAHGAWGRLAFVGMMALQVVVAMIPGEPLEIAAGYVFGNIEGLILCLLGAAIGTAIIFLFTKHFGIKMVEAFISREKLESVKFLHNPEKRNLLVFLLFFIPGTPKDVITYVIGITSMRLPIFLLLSSVGRIPSVITSTIVGDALGTESYMTAIIVFAVTGAAAAAGMWFYHWFCKEKSRKNHVK